ncbi:hypothetical protein Tsubulata_006321 [Turnera subulata]|uniref:Plant/F9H3-4 protein n=1 Tax=Turnera subulata TaxID=218843 RepID=A0A9Q0JKV6_9ROSI|nr:hypothetical protein Tsubulata_006321 [Turnera subulata]
MSSSSLYMLLPSSPKSNLERFIQCVTPVAPSRSLPQLAFSHDGCSCRKVTLLLMILQQSCIHDVNSLPQHSGSKDVVEHFSLSDLWDCYDEWSAYGAGTQIQSPCGESIMQYYVPYLSAIQLYCNKSVVASRNNGRECNSVAEMESDSWSDESMSDTLSRSLSNNSSRTWDTISEDSSVDHEGCSPTRDKLGCLYMQYFEMSLPCWRVPLMEKITELAKDHPGLMTLRNVDLSPASWMAVAWYPIYHIPSRRNEKDLSTCFLTYHTLSSSFQDCEDECDNMTESFEETGRFTETKLKAEGSGGISLPPFGLASYKMQGDLWINPETYDYERIFYLSSAADSWLKQLNVHHHDYNFFTCHAELEHALKGFQSKSFCY